MAENSDSREQVAKANELFNKGDYSSALQILLPILQREPSNVDILLSVVQCHHRLKDYANMMKYAEQLKNVAPNRYEPYNFLGLCALDSQKDPNLALELLNEGIKRAPNVWSLYFNRGECYFIMNRYEEAIKEYTIALQLNPKAINVLRARADIYIKTNNLKQALYDAELVAELDPNDKGWQNMLSALKNFDAGKALFDKNDNRGAIEYFVKAAIALPKSADAAYYAGRTYYRIAEYDRSMEYIKRFLELDPNRSGGHNVLGLLYLNQKRYDEAITEFDLAIKFDEKDAVVHSNKGDTYFLAQKFDDALKEYNTAISMNPSNPGNFLGRAQTYFSLNKKQEGIADLRTTLLLYPANKTAKDLIQEKIGVQLSDEEIKGGLTQFNIVEAPKETFNDVAGMDELKEVLRKAIIYPFLYADLTKEYGVRAGGGVLLYGPPGCGKTFIAKAVAGEAKANLIDAKLSDVFGVWVGTTEKNIHNMFELARHNTPAILFVDELDALGGARGIETGAKTYAQATNVFLTELDGVSTSNDNILVLGATNAPWFVDPAVKRSGRLGQLIYVPPPDMEERKALFQLYLKSKPIEDNIDFDKLAAMSEAFSASDIALICREAGKKPWEEAIKSGVKRKIRMDDLTSTLAAIKPTLPAWYESAKIAIAQAKDLYPELAKDIDEYEKRKSHGAEGFSAYR